MSWLSGIIGGGIGAMLGGPFGAIIGAAIGSNIGGGQKVSAGAGRVGFSEAQRRQALFFTAAFSMVGKLAQADGRVCEDEIDALKRISRDALRLDGQTLSYALSVFNQAKSSPEPFEAYAREFGSLFGQDQQMCSFMMSFLFEVAMADGQLHPGEEQMLLSAKEAFRLHDSIYQSLRDRFVGSASPTRVGLAKHFEALGVSEEADVAAIKKAYRKKASEFHPDKIEGKGLPPEFIKLANDKLAEINASYEALMTAHKAA
ncbi:MAG: co-chaperone DjlA [Desulfuromonas sp.]|uniref:co-chaperone DjlA n=1 Tax=Desulfuromonas sp. TaxID=892 RepID=UPI000CC2BC6E|nr:co-chaperone DjlA [Desulfuromonas sp.]PLX84208.1 MAG: co-chaperone DjlA [Desulfuromonas sp.]